MTATTTPKFNCGVLFPPREQGGVREERQTPFEFLQRHLMGIGAKNYAKRTARPTNRPSSTALGCSRPTS